MKLGIMQPYLFPYIGYFQLIAVSDHFVIHDDVQYIKGGWINRNRILVNGEPQYITLPVRKDASHLDINQRFFTPEFAVQKESIVRQIEGAYHKAPHFNEVYKLIRECFKSTETNVSSFITKTINRCCEYLAITTPITSSSSLRFDSTSQGETRVLAINKTLGADHYINPIGGVELYQRKNFESQGLQLQFLKTNDIKYPQFSNPFVPSLSIIDVMMFNSRDRLHGMLGEYELL